ncbi:sorbosone dehydrogenase family protein [Leptolyngbya sp. BC1307]|uniref:PQQ-dependent sugar dehydrogenase n=1 Tax=Leptolyngbya sp. BC1307 TaxID=2029589 RepID=UPI000EFB25E3|nr:sorbosone dehydrogenase family protein [Leptolyngbya sp. BC1307]
MRYWKGLIGLTLLLGSCQGIALQSESGQIEQSQDQPTSAETSSSTEATAPPERAQISTQPLNPEPINISVDELPAPYASDSANQPPNVIAPPANASLNVPDGFTVNLFAEGLDNPRWLALTPDGDVLVTETRQNRIQRLVDADGNGVAETKETFATARNGLNIPFGMAFAEGSFFLGNTDEVVRFPWTTGQTALEGQGDRIATLPGGGYNQHWTRNVVVSPEGDRLYVSIGSQSNANEEPAPRASVQTMGLDGSNARTFASGLRNPVGLDFHPTTGDLYATVNERDGLGDDLVPDYFTRIQSGEFFGWPYAYLSPKNLDPRQVVNGVSKAPDLVQETRSPDVLFQAHSAALGLQFYDGDTFPERYQNGAFVAFRGSWNRSAGTGYKVVFIPFENGRPTGSYEDFLTGFLTDPSVPTTWARPVGLLAMPDGSLLITDEANNRIYRVQYAGA